jgi:hypothetical protein
MRPAHRQTIEARKVTPVIGAEAYGVDRTR